MRRHAKANVSPIRQQTQYTCVTASTCMALNAVGVDCDEEQVNRVIGAKPMQGARWEEVLACAQYFGCRATLTTPATLSQVKAWTDQGKPVLIAWNPEGRDWSHASLIFDVTGERGDYTVHIADPNIPNPDKTTRQVGEDEFYAKWFEKWPNYLVRRPALMIEKEIDGKGRQIMASDKRASRPSSERFLNAVKEITSSIRHLGYIVRYDHWTSAISPMSMLLSFKVAAVGIGNYTIDFQWHAHGESTASFVEGREVIHTAIGESDFPHVMRHLPSSQMSKLASDDGMFSCLLSTTNITLDEVVAILKALPHSLKTVREVAIELAGEIEKLDDFVLYDNSLSLIDILMRDLAER